MTHLLLLSDPYLRSRSYGVQCTTQTCIFLAFMRYVSGKNIMSNFCFNQFTNPKTNLPNVWNDEVITKPIIFQSLKEREVMNDQFLVILSNHESRMYHNSRIPERYIHFHEFANKKSQFPPSQTPLGASKISNTNTYSSKIHIPAEYFRLKLFL